MTEEENPTTTTDPAELSAPQSASPSSFSPALLLSGTGLLLLTLFGASVLASSGTPEVQRTAAIKQAPAPPNYQTAFENIELQAKAAYVYDVAHDRPLFSLNAETQLPLASLTKVMTAIVATESLSYDSVVAVDAEALRLEGDSGLYVDEEWRARDLLDFMLLVSSNDSASALASAAGAIAVTAEASEQPLNSRDAFIERMNQKAEEIGLTQTYFLNETGLDTSEDISGGYGSARDAARLLAYAIKNTPEALDATAYPALAFTSLSNITHEVGNTNEIVGKIPGLIASKTGYTTLAGGNLVIAFDAGVNRPIIISVLGSSRDGRFSDVEKLIAAALTAINLEQ